MTLLRDISFIWSMFHVLIIFVILFESRYSGKKTHILTLCLMGPLLLLNVWLFLAFGPEAASQMVLLSCTLPSLVFFFIMSKHRDGRFFFTFCLADTASMEILYATNMLDWAINDPMHIAIFAVRLLAFPLLEWAALKFLRRPYLEMQGYVKKGWWGFALISAIFYVLLVLMYSFPSLATERPEYIPAVLLVMLLMPMVYWCILTTIFRQAQLFRAQEQEQILKTQASMLQQQVQQTARAQEQMAIQRHDLRHRFLTLGTMLEKGEMEAARDYIDSATETLAETKVKRWCANPVLDAVFSHYFAQAEALDIAVEADLDVPEELHVDAAELSTVFANALENAINAVSALPPERRLIRCRCIRRPQLMFRVSNPYEGRLSFDAEGRPLAASKSHGLGTRSIAAYCQKHGAYCDYRAEDGWFSIQIIQP